MGLILTGTSLVIFLGYYFTYPFVRTLMKAGNCKTALNQNTQKPYDEHPTISQPTLTSPEESTQ